MNVEFIHPRKYERIFQNVQLQMFSKHYTQCLSTSIFVPLPLAQEYLTSKLYCTFTYSF
jgi:hypothetical protein